MRFHPKLLLAALAATALLAAAVGTASANRLSLNDTQFEILWNVPLSGSGGGRITAECAITMQGSFHSATFSKTNGLLIGLITSVTVGEARTCVRGAMTVLRETLPWHFRYQSFAGRLPGITAVTFQLIGASYRVEELFGNACLFRTTTENPSRLIANLEAGTVVSLRADETSTFPMTGSPICELQSANFTGIGSLTRLSGRALTITLV